MERKAIIFGATGKTGAQIAEQFELQNISYSVFVRKGSEEKLIGNTYNLIQGDVLNPDNVADGFKKENYTDVIIALGSKELKNTVLRSEGTKHVIEAMNANTSTARIHIISAFGVGDSWEHMGWFSKVLSNVLLKSVMIDHQKQEDLVLASSFDYHIIRPVGLKDGKSKGDIQVETHKPLKKTAIRRVDVAKYLVESLLDNKNGISNIAQK